MQFGRVSSLCSGLLRIPGRSPLLRCKTPSLHASTVSLTARRLPTTDHKAVGYWLLGSSAAVFGIIVFGGLTRLTESGLSMVDWKLIHFKAPQSEHEWQEYFLKYQQFPEYQVINQDMTLEQFKRIYYMEHYHRVYGRLLGLGIIVPSVVFSALNWVTPRTRKFLAASSALVVFQGLLGWYMVKSGLKREIVENREVPRVSSYRLAAHLGSAFALYGLLLNGAINILSPSHQSTVSAKLASSPEVIKRLKSRAHSLATLLLFTVISGAFVAGLDAGLIYNSFPLMGGNVVPSDIWDSRLGWRNPFENPACAQFNHRVLAVGSVAGVSSLWLQGRRLAPLLPRHVQILLHCLMGAAWGQASLGVLTLLHNVPIPLASAHQAGSVTVLTFALWLVNRLKYLRM